MNFIWKKKIFWIKFGDYMRQVSVSGKSFPDIIYNSKLIIEDNKLWQVLCGDEGRWRCGIYSPEIITAAEIKEYESHTCPELFLLIEGAITLALFCENKGFYEIELQKNIPVLVTDYHSGYSKNGKYTGKALVIERDFFSTTYKTKNELSNVILKKD